MFYFLKNTDNEKSGKRPGENICNKYISDKVLASIIHNRILKIQ